MAETVVHAGLGDTLINVNCTPLTWKHRRNEWSSLWKLIPTEIYVGPELQLGQVGLLQGYAGWSPASGSPLRLLCP